MPKFSEGSEEKLATCHPDLQKLLHEVVKKYDCTVTCGYRGEAEQNEAFDKGFSKLRFPNGNHNKSPSLAVDVYPYPVDWSDTKRASVFAGYVLGVASQMGLEVRWGGDWDRDWDLADNVFNDYPHFELVL